jgi:predicted  nucleic acid-binding Zn-ribbon protein
MADPWMDWMERMEKQISNLQTMVQRAKILLDKNSKEVTEINRRLSKEEKNYEENSTARTSDKLHHGNLNSMPS